MNPDTPEKTKPYPWFIHPQSGKLTLLGKERTLRLIEQFGERETFDLLQKKYNDKYTDPGVSRVFLKLFRYLSYGVQEEILSTLDGYDLLHQYMKTRINAHTIQKRKQVIQDALRHSCGQKIILCRQSELLDPEIYDGIWLYIRKHGAHICAFATSEEEVTEIASNQLSGTVRLIIISHWGIGWFKFAIWHEEKRSISASISDLINRTPQIGALRLIACRAGELHETALSLPKYVKDKDAPIHRKYTFIFEANQSKGPFSNKSLAGEIWNNVREVDPYREFSLTASPSALKFFNGHFVGFDGHDHTASSPGFIHPDLLESAKSACATTPRGLKSPLSR